MLPNVLVIGAGKSGTTSLHHYLGLHPQVAMSRVKEADFWHRPDWRERLGWYSGLFEPGTAIRGESCPSYSVYPIASDVPRRIHATLPDIRLIYLVRDPVERFVAHYTQHLANAKESRPIREVVRASLEGRDAPHGYLAGSSYGTQLDQYLAYFPSSQIYVIDSVDLRHRRRETLRRAFDFLGVDPAFDAAGFDTELLQRSDQVRFGPFGRRLRRSRFVVALKARVPYEVRQPITKRIRRIIAEPVTRPVLDPIDRTSLEERLRPEADRLREQTGKAFAAWSV